MIVVVSPLGRTIIVTGTTTVPFEAPLEADGVDGVDRSVGVSLPDKSPSNDDRKPDKSGEDEAVSVVCLLIRVELTYTGRLISLGK